MARVRQPMATAWLFFCFVQNSKRKRRAFARRSVFMNARVKPGHDNLNSVIQERSERAPARMLQLPQCLRLDLTNTFACHRELPADFFQRVVGVHGGCLRRWVRSERAHRSSDHRDIFERCVAVLRLTPRALDCDDHLLGRIDEDDLAKGAIRRKGTVVDAARQGWRRPPVVAVSRRRTGHEPTEGGGRAVGLSGEIAPAGRQDPSASMPAGPQIVSAQ